MESSSSSFGSVKRARMPNGTQIPSCLVDGCTSDLSKCREYHRRHKVCEIHSKTPKVFIKGQEQRFCQQCSRFHSLVEFDEGKRSCRKRLDGHNKRRRKPQPDSLSVNSAGLFHQGTRYLSFGNSQVYSRGAAGSAWSGIVKAENDPVLYENQSSISFSGTKNLFPGTLPHSFKAGKQFPFLQGTSNSSTLLGDSVCQPIVNTNSMLGSSGSNQKLFSDGLNQVTGSNRALSLLSSPQAESREIGFSHMVQTDLNPSAQSLITSLNYNGLGIDSEPGGGHVMVSDGSSNTSLHRHDAFQIGHDGSSATGSHQTLSFSWD